MLPNGGETKDELVKKIRDSILYLNDKIDAAIANINQKVEGSNGYVEEMMKSQDDTVRDLHDALHKLADNFDNMSAARKPTSSAKTKSK